MFQLKKQETKILNFLKMKEKMSKLKKFRRLKSQIFFKKWGRKLHF